jgi:hypothetical protein
LECTKSGASLNGIVHLAAMEPKTYGKLSNSAARATDRVMLLRGVTMLGVRPDLVDHVSDYGARIVRDYGVQSGSHILLTRPAQEQAE